MTVRETVSALRHAERIALGYGANAIHFDPKDPLAMDAYGDYVVDEITTDDGKYYEVNIAVRPIRQGNEGL